MRITTAGLPIRGWRLPSSAGAWVVLSSQQPPVLAWLRVLIFAFLVALLVMAIGYCVHWILSGGGPSRAAAEADGEQLAREPQCQGNLLQTCGVCQQVHPMEALIPCGHMLCGGCRVQVGTRCPFCRSSVEAGQPVFQP
mmetsp:Transcript_48435/g.140293  ORF Transcript_48435/g.140293 Transcript_48435/m.140293 type:complete len:139 (-) Transcript_48435:53-469(-)